MFENIIKFITNYIPLTDEEIDIIRETNLIESYKKNTILLSEGEVAKECYFILQGCIRSYYVIDGEERTTEFYTESQPITPVSYVTKQPSEYYLSCLEDCVVSLGTRNQILLEKLPKLETLLLKLNGEMLVQNQVSFDNFKNFSPEKRYLDLIETRPELINRVPQYHLATYLGITPVSLSRMRKRLSSGKSARKA